MRRPGTGSGAFILEVLIMTAVFAMSAAVCMQIFARARVISRESGILSQASVTCQSAAECWRASGGDMEETARLMDAVTLEGEAILTGDGWTMEISETAPGVALIEAWSGNNSVFAISVKAVSP